MQQILAFIIFYQNIQGVMDMSGTNENIYALYFPDLVSKKNINKLYNLILLHLHNPFSLFFFQIDYCLPHPKEIQAHLDELLRNIMKKIKL